MKIHFVEIRVPTETPTSTTSPYDWSNGRLTSRQVGLTSPGNNMSNNLYIYQRRI